MGNICICSKQESVGKNEEVWKSGFSFKKTHGCEGPQTKASVYYQKIHVILMTSP